MQKQTSNSTIFDPEIIDLKLERMKPLGLKWLIEACRYVENNNFIQNGFSEAGIIGILNPDT